jgi:NADH dehydrogenase FAD-containing subunit
LSEVSSAASQSLGRLVLLGAGPVNLQIMAALAKKAIAGLQVTLVTPQQRPVNPAMLAGFVAGHFTLEECSIDLAAWVQRAGIGWLCIDTGANQNREHIKSALPGARKNAMFVHPVNAFAALWPQVAAMGDARAMRISVVGAGATGTALALAIRQRLPSAALTLLCGPGVPASRYPLPLQQRLQSILQAKRVTVLPDTAKAFSMESISLGCGAELATDASLLATGTHAPPWLAGSGLALDDQGFMALDEYKRSTSHHRIFAPAAVQSATYDLRAKLLSVHNLHAAMTGGLLKPHLPSTKCMNLIPTGRRHAVGSWGAYSAQGRLVWQLKTALDAIR